MGRGQENITDRSFTEDDPFWERPSNQALEPKTEALFHFKLCSVLLRVMTTKNAPYQSPDQSLIIDPFQLVGM